MFFFYLQLFNKHNRLQNQVFVMRETLAAAEFTDLFIGDDGSLPAELLCDQ